jgi:hypothetical protein
MTGFVIESNDYENTRQRLMKDPIVIAMADDVSNYDISKLTHEGGNPNFEFMMKANEEYRRRGGTDGGHLGAIAEAVLRLATCTE